MTPTRTRPKPRDPEGDRAQPLSPLATGAHHGLRLVCAQSRQPGGRAIFLVDACRVCGVSFAGPLRQRVKLESLLTSHEQVCPGGHREGEIARPLG